MNVSVNQRHLAVALGVVGRSVGVRSSLAVLHNVMISADTEGVFLSATDLNVYVKCWLPGDVEDAGSVTLPAKLLTEFVNSLPPEKIEMELIKKEQSAILSCGKFRSKIKGVDALDFPKLPVWDEIGDRSQSLVAADFSEWVDRVAFAASGDASRPTLNGIEFNVSADGVTMAATDGFRLSLVDVKVKADGIDFGKVVVPSKSLAEVQRIIGIVKPERIDLTFGENKNQIHFKFRGETYNVEIGCTLIDAKFPDYRAIIPKSATTKFVCDPNQLLRAVKMAMLFARDNANITRIRIAFKPESSAEWCLYVSGVSSEMGDGASEIDITGDGTPVEIAFDGSFLIEALGKISGAMLSAELSTANRPMLMKVFGDNTFLHVIMPMQPR